MQQNKSLTLPQGYPLYIKGDYKLIRNLKLTLSTTLSFPKSIQIHLPFIPKPKQTTSLIPLLEPIIYLQIIDDNIREQVIRKKYELKGDTFYIYYPTQFRVDEKIYKGLIKNYETLIDELPRSFKPYLHKLILWQQGKGQHSIQYQKHKINQSLSQISKQQIQSKLNSFISQIKNYQSQPSTSKSLLHIFVLKNKLACLYNHLNLRQFAHDLLTDVWNQMMINFRVLMKLKENNKFGAIQKLEMPEDIPKLPYIFQNTNDILGYFESNHSTAYLRIVTHAFIKYFKYCLALALETEALGKLKFFMDFVLNNVLVLTRRNQWTKKQMGMFDLARNLWAVQVIIKCVADFQLSWQSQEIKKERIKSDKGEPKLEDIAKFRVSIMSMLRNSVQRIGLILYTFDNYSIFPTIIPQQINFIYEKIKKLKRPWHETKKSVESIKQQQMGQIVEKTASMIRREQFVLEIPQVGGNQLKIKELISQKMVPTLEVTKILVNFQAYSQVYLGVLQQMYDALKSSPFKKVAKSLKLTLERATIMLGDWQDYQKVHDQPYQFEKQWPQLHAIQELYKLFFLLVKFLSNQLPQNSLIVNQVIRILKNQQLADNYLRNVNDIEVQNKNGNNKTKISVLQIANAVSQVLSAYGLNLVFSFADKITVKEQIISEQRKEVSLQIIILQENISQILSKAKNWKLIGNRVMLGQGQIIFDLYDTVCKQSRRCLKCKQCNYLCSNQKDSKIYTTILSKLRLQSSKEQHLFQIDKLCFEIETEQSCIDLCINLSEQQAKNIYKINSPVLQLIGQKYPVVYTESWAPVRIRISNIINEVSLVSVRADLRNVLDQFRDAKDLQIDLSKENRNPSISISDLINLRSQNIQSADQYFTMTQTIHKNLSKNQYLTFFLLSKKFQKIHRNSNRKSGQTRTNQHIDFQLKFKCMKTQRQYTLTLSTESITIQPLLQLQYLIVQTCEQFTIKNVGGLQLIIYENLGKKQQEKKIQSDELMEVCYLDQEEIVCVESRFIVIGLKEFKKMKFYINLNDWFESQHLLTQKNNTFKIWYTQQYNYEIFKPIQIQSQIVGRVQIPYLPDTTEQGLEIVGKISGEVQYLIDKLSQSEGENINKKIQNKFINIWIIPIKTGNVVLPEIWIDGKRGIWANSLVTNIEGS